MPIPSSPALLTNVLGYAADLNSIPATTPTGSGAFSYQAGFPPITGFPLTAGGIAPSRQDFNGVFNLIGQHLFFLQSGSLYPWSASLDYLVGAHVLGSDGKEYIAQKSSGPDVPSAPAVNPVGDDSGTWMAATLAYGAPLATSSSPGLIQPDGETCTVNGNGVLSTVPVMYNSRLVLTESNPAWKPQFSGWAKITAIGGGGGGGGGGRSTSVGNGGAQGGSTSFATDLVAAGGSGGGGGGAVPSGGGYPAATGGGGGGGAGKISIGYLYISSSNTYPITIGSGGGVNSASDGAGPEGGNAASSFYSGGSGAGGASSGGTGVINSNNSGCGGSGGSNGMGFGGGGGGASYNGAVGIGVDGGENGTGGDSCATGGGVGGAGAVIIEYYDKSKETSNA